MKCSKVKLYSVDMTSKIVLRMSNVV